MNQQVDVAHQPSAVKRRKAEWGQHLGSPDHGGWQLSMWVDRTLPPASLSAHLDLLPIPGPPPPAPGIMLTKVRTHYEDEAWDGRLRVAGQADPHPSRSSTWLLTTGPGGHAVAGPSASACC